MARKNYDGPTEEGMDAVKPSQDTTARHSRDQMLRRKGFKIHSRPKHGGAVWEKGGKLYHQEAAELLAGLDAP
jgi:hypothetical protein